MSDDDRDDDDDNDDDSIPFKRSPSRGLPLRSSNERFLDLLNIDVAKKPSPIVVVTL